MIVHRKVQIHNTNKNMYEHIEIKESGACPLPTTMEDRRECIVRLFFSKSDQINALTPAADNVKELGDDVQRCNETI